MIVDDGLIFLCMADEDFGKRQPYAFLEEVRGLSCFVLKCNSRRSEVREEGSGLSHKPHYIRQKDNSISKLSCFGMKLRLKVNFFSRRIDL